MKHYGQWNEVRTSVGKDRLRTRLRVRRRKCCQMVVFQNGNINAVVGCGGKMFEIESDLCYKGLGG